MRPDCFWPVAAKTIPILIAKAPTLPQRPTRSDSADYLGALMRADKYAVKTIDLSYLNQAIQLFNTQEGRLPKDLNELVPNYVGKLPATPYGTKLDYDPNTGVVKVVPQ